MAQRRKDPIFAKNEGRKVKVNLNSFKSKFLTMKKKVSALQLEVGAEEDFILIVRNNLQDPLTAHQSTTAGRYMVYEVDPIAENFYTTGIKFESDEMVKMANNYDYAQDLSVNCVTEKTANGKNAKTAEKRKSNQVVDVRAAKKQKKGRSQLKCAHLEVSSTIYLLKVPVVLTVTAPVMMMQSLMTKLTLDFMLKKAEMCSKLTSLF